MPRPRKKPRVRRDLSDATETFLVLPNKFGLQALSPMCSRYPRIVGDTKQDAGMGQEVFLLPMKLADLYIENHWGFTASLQTISNTIKTRFAFL